MAQTFTPPPLLLKTRQLREFCGILRLPLAARNYSAFKSLWSKGLKKTAEEQKRNIANFTAKFFAKPKIMKAQTQIKTNNAKFQIFQFKI